MNDDLISRQAAIDAMNAHLEDVKRTWGRKVKKGEIAMCLDLRGVIETLPSVQPDCSQSGKWYDVGSLSCRCSRCGCKSNKETRYCPNCGARMEGE